MSPLLSPYQLSDTIALQVTMPLWCSSVQDLEQVLQGCAALLSTHLTHTVAMKSCVGADLWSISVKYLQLCVPVHRYSSHTELSGRLLMLCYTDAKSLLLSAPRPSAAVLLSPDVSAGMLILMTCKHVLKSLRKMQILLSQITMANNSTRISNRMSTKTRVMHITFFFLFRNLQAQVQQTQKRAKSVVAWKPNTDGWNMD